MDYTLLVLTHGKSPTLDGTLASFLEHVLPAPTESLVVCDGPGPGQSLSETQLGFCEATRRAWAIAAEAPTSHVFWLEHDFRFDRDVDLAELAAVLDVDRELAQMALLRQPVNEAERAAGGLVESRPGQFELQDGLWMRQRSFFTTNPSLMRTTFMLGNPWPAYPDQCEGRFGIDLIERGYAFGMWGAGEPWVSHFGVRDGFGY
jgi:hypothetical protein